MSKGDPHDHLFKSVFSEPSQAAAWLKATLSGPIAEEMDFESLTLMPGSFVDDSLKEWHTDLLFAGRIVALAWSTCSLSIRARPTL
jgi:predicted transposase YdaD